MITEVFVNRNVQEYEYVQRFNQSESLFVRKILARGFNGPTETAFTLICLHFHFILRIKHLAFSIFLVKSVGVCGCKFHAHIV